MLVSVMRQTYWRSRLLVPGSTLEVPKEVGARWIKFGIARVADAQEAPLDGTFPGHAALALAGITTPSAVPRSEAALTSIPGIGRATAQRILRRLE